MKKISEIKDIAYVLNSIEENVLANFYKEVKEIIQQFQRQNLDVEIQYQQSHKHVSALIIGRAKE